MGELDKVDSAILNRIQSDFPITSRPYLEVADELGFSSPAAFSRWFTRLAGQSPKQYREDPTQL